MSLVSVPDQVSVSASCTNLAAIGAGIRTPSLKQAEAEHIARAMTDCGGNIS